MGRWTEGTWGLDQKDMVMFPGQWSLVSKTQEMSIPNRNREGPRAQPPPSRTGRWELGTAFREEGKGRSQINRAFIWKGLSLRSEMI